MKLNSIQFLRAVAALLVVYEHSMDIQEKFGSSWQQKIFYLDNFGCIGVDLFFVISGFIITYVAKKHSGITQGLYFLAKRFTRINPTYYIATIFCLASFILRLAIYKTPFSKDLNQTISSLMDSILLVPTSNNINSFIPFLIVGWTLAFEWLFYGLFFVTILFKIKCKILFLPGFILLLIISGQIIHPNDLRLQFITNPILLEFVLGIIICQLYLSLKKIPVWIGTTCLASGLITYLFLIRFGYGDIWHYHNTINGNSSFLKFVLWGIPSSCIVAGCVFLEKNERLGHFWNNKWVALGGDASYSIYLIHYTVLNLFPLLYRKTGLYLPPDLMIWLQIIIAVAISIGFYKLIEKPLLHYLNKSNLWNITQPLQPGKIKTETNLTIEVSKPIAN